MTWWSGGVVWRWVWLECTGPGAARGWVKFRGVCVCVRVCVGGVCPLSHCSERPLHHASIFIGQVCHIVSLRIVKVKSLSHVRLFATPWTVAYQAPPSMGFSRQKYSSGLPFPSPGDLPDPGIKPEPGSPESEADALTSEPPGTTANLG